MVYDAGVGEAGNIQFFDSVPTRLGYVGFAANDDMRIWAENTGGAVLFATQNTTRGSIAADGPLGGNEVTGAPLGTNLLMLCETFEALSWYM